METSCASTDPSCQVTPNPNYTPNRLPSSSLWIDPPDCYAPGMQARTQSGETLQPGRYTKITLSGNDTLTLNPGLYCLSGGGGDALKVTGGYLFGNGVTIFIESGGVSLNGGVVDLRAPDTSPNPSPAIPGVLIYSKEGNTKEIALTGNEDSYFLGTIFAPSGDLKIVGTSGTHPTFHTQLIAFNVQVSGTADIDINFNGPKAHNLDPKLELFR